MWKGDHVAEAVYQGKLARGRHVDTRWHIELRVDANTLGAAIRGPCKRRCHYCGHHWRKPEEQEAQRQTQVQTAKILSQR